MLRMAKNLYIIDGHAHIYAAYYAPMRPLTSPGGDPTKASYIFTTILLGLIERNKPDMLVVTMDSKAKSFRSDIYPDYKAHRKPMPDDMPPQIAQIEKILDAMNIPILRIDGFEADDIIGTLTTKASKAKIASYICSKDKDMLQLLDDNTCMFDIKKSKRTDCDTLMEDMGLRPDQFVDVLALQGDTADNIPGVPDVGPKTAIGWIVKYGTLDNLYEHADEIKGKRGDNLRANKEQAYLSRTLATIKCDVQVDIDEKGFSLKEPDKQKLAKLFTELGFTRLITQLGLSKDAEHGQDATKTAHAKPKPAKRDYKLIDSEEKLDEFLTKLKKQKIFAIDTETTSVNAMAASLVGMSFSWKAGDAFYLPIKAPMGQKHLDVACKDRCSSFVV